MPTEQQQIDEARERFLKETAGHDMVVLHDDGLYRHVRFQQPGSSAYWYELITWPGKLAVSGDCGDFMFARLNDMFQFFASDHGRINPHYWSEKLLGDRRGRDIARRYSEATYRERVAAWTQEIISDYDLQGDEAASFRRAVDEQLLEDYTGELQDESVAHARLRDFHHGEHYISDSWEWDLREWDWQYLWCCWAIAEGVRRYRELTPAAAAA